MNDQYPFQVMRLPYSYVALGPCCDADTLYLHHDQYYAKKVMELNRLVNKHRLQDWTLAELVSRKADLPTVMGNHLRDTGGAVYNHELFFDSLRPQAGEPPLNRLVEEILSTYGTLPRFERLLVEAAQSLPGAGWVWLAAERDGGLHIVLTDDNETVPPDALHPIFALDLWEHAYFPDHQFDKEKYVNALVSLIDWEKADARYLRRPGQRG